MNSSVIILDSPQIAIATVFYLLDWTQLVSALYKNKRIYIYFRTTIILK